MSKPGHRGEYDDERLKPMLDARRLSNKGKRISKPIRFTLVERLVERLESMTKGERDTCMTKALELND